MTKLLNTGLFDFWRMTFVRNDQRLRYLTEAELGELRADRVNAILRLTPQTTFVTAINAMALMLVFGPCGHDTFLMGWFSTLLVIMAKWYLDWRKGHAKSHRRTMPPKVIKILTGYACVVGLLWALPMVTLFPDASADKRAILLCVAAGMVCGGTLTFGTVWQAALAYGAPVMLATVVAIVRLGNPTYYPVLFFALTYSLIVAYVVIERAELFVVSRLNMLKLREISTLRGRRLEEIEQSSAEIQWLTDPQGRLRDVSGRLAELFCMKPAQLEMMPLSAVFAGGRPLAIFLPDSSDARHIRSCIRHQRAITRRTISPMLRGESRCWALIGQPQFDLDGHFAGYSGTVSDVTDLLRMQPATMIQAQTDALTGLPNRLAFQRVVETRLKASSVGFTVLSLDLDGFKAVNDSHGHGVGDELLRQCADRMRGDIRPDELAVRLGGDEFALVLSVAMPEMVHNIAQRLLAKLAEPYNIDGSLVRVGVSIGFALAPQDGTTFKQLLHNSDLALYRAKTGGKGQSMAFAREMNSEHQLRRQLELDLRKALGTPQIRMVYQPIINLADGRIMACEALVRWTHPERGNIPPCDFIPLAEETGIIFELGLWITETACREAMNWPGDIRVAVNVSTVQFRNQGFVGQIATALAATGLSPRRLEIEITESVLIKDQARTVDTFQKLRDTGVRISLDDFGTGYSSLAYLADFTIDTIKIDQSFVRKMQHQQVAATIVRSITALAANLGVETIGEGVETREQLQLLSDTGCNEGQGYLFSRPLPADEIAALIKLRNEGASPYVDGFVKYPAEAAWARQVA